MRQPDRSISFFKSRLSSAATICIALSLGLAFTASSCLAEDNLSKASTLYSQGKYTEALEFVEAELKSNPRSAQAHYLFGHILLSRNNFREAIHEYRQAADLAPTGQIGQNSKQILARLKPWDDTPAPQAAGQPSPPAAPQNPPQEDPERADMRSAITTTNRLLGEKSMAVTDEYQKRATEIKLLADKKIAELTQEMEGLIAANGRPVMRQGVVYYDPTPQNDAIRREYMDRIDAVRDECNRRTEEMSQLHKKKQEAIEQEGLSLDHVLANPIRPGDIKVVPKGTNLHVRNYESSDEASGHVVPMVAEPGRLGEGAGGKGSTGGKDISKAAPHAGSGNLGKKSATDKSAADKNAAEKRSANTGAPDKNATPNKSPADGNH